MPCMFKRFGNQDSCRQAGGLSLLRIRPALLPRLAGEKYLDKPLDSDSLGIHAGRELYMTASVLLYKRKTFFLVILFIIFSAFTADILDLREELCLHSCPYSVLDDNVSTGFTSNHLFKLEQMLFVYSVQGKTAVKISFLSLLPYNFRAPPSWS
jgi:hypothetical protein